MKLKFSILYFFLFTATFQSYASDIDSLLQLVDSTKIDTNQANLLNEISDKYLQSNYILAEKYGRKALEISKELNYEIGIADAYYHVGYAVYYTIDINTSLDFYKKALKLYQKIGLKEKEGVMYNDIAYIYGDLGNSKKQIEYSFKSEKVFNEIKSYHNLVSVYDNIGFVFDKIGDEEKALKYYEKCISLAPKIKDLSKLSIPYSNAGQCYLLKKDTIKALEYYALAEKYANKGGELFSKVIIADRYGNYYFNKKDYSLAEKYYNKSYELNKDAKNKEGISRDLLLLADLNLITENMDKAEKYALQSLEIIEQLDLYSRKEYAYNLLTRIFSKKKDYSKAFEYQSKLVNVKDSLNRKSIVDKLEEMEGKYQSEKKELEITNLKVESEKKDLEVIANKQQRNIFIYGFIFVFLFSIGSIYAFNQKIKDNKKIQLQKILVEEVNEELNQTNEEILAQRDQIDEQRAILEQKNYLVTESISSARRIQTAFFQTEDEEKKKLPEHFAYFKPRDIVSGDFYWSHINQENPNILYISVADCTGHGVPGALMSMLGLSFINEILKEEPDIFPSSLLTELKDKIIRALNQSESNATKEGIDMSVVRLNLDTNELHYAGANNPLYYISDGKLNKIKGSKQPVGISEIDRPFEEHKVKLQKGDYIYLFTDGYADQFGGPKGKKLGYKRFREKLLYIHTLPLSTQKEELKNYFLSWMNKEEQVDDVCIIGIKF